MYIIWNSDCVNIAHGVVEGGEDLSDLKCEPDEYALIVREVKNSGLVKDHRYHLRTYKNSFVGQEMVDWLVKNKNMCKLKWQMDVRFFIAFLSVCMSVIPFVLSATCGSL